MSKVGKTPDNPVPEKEFRHKLLNTAKVMGCEMELKQIFEKYDRALKRCTNETERKHIGACGAAEIHRLFGSPGALVVDQQVIVPAQENYTEEGDKIIKTT